MDAVSCVCACVRVCVFVCACVRKKICKYASLRETDAMIHHCGPAERNGPLHPAFYTFCIQLSTLSASSFLHFLHPAFYTFYTQLSTLSASSFLHFLHPAFYTFCIQLSTLSLPSVTLQQSVRNSSLGFSFRHRRNPVLARNTWRCHYYFNSRTTISTTDASRPPLTRAGAGGEALEIRH